MPQLRLTIQTITPLLMYGADNKDDRTNSSIRAEPELRATAIRGLLRYWLRAVLGGKFTAISKVYEQESAILGSTNTGSRVNVRVQKGSSMQVEANQTVLPRQTRGYTLSHTGFVPDSEFRITLSTHLLDKSGVLDENGDLVKAVFLMTHFSGLGRRSRRGSGNLRVLGVKGYESELPLDVLPENRDALTQYLAAVSFHISPQSQTVGRRPSFPVFAWDTAVVLVGRQKHIDYEDAYKELWTVSGPYHQEGGIFGDVRPRRSSAIHMRVAATKAGYVAQQTILWSGNGQWNKMKDYIQHCLSQGFDDVYGTWGHWQ
ncbi:type III-B CRISPR module RAMP protein Cmr1 [Phototrophicus methaneseepsis]|uniref:Type III-B CRISPR module RAMP protein Cmr1 n=1 Tax=Phototrophicus methaneseepsis TaxID=2710758 RepID=A0A7S8E5W7_9CHLR|nr:type III-B CRISPR module RAMP protein Cmr1 [Phototrophicus methaneseepsis]QPC80930.1 type III-B CRISPR module RAMP protein Cmr1 [Phototrophicus methaneseepsis]